MADEPDETPAAPPGAPAAPERAAAGAPQPDFDERRAVEQLLQARDQSTGGNPPGTGGTADTTGNAAAPTDLDARTADIPLPAAAAAPAPAPAPAEDAADAPAAEPAPAAARDEPRDHTPEHARTGKSTPSVRITRITPLDTQSSPLVIDPGGPAPRRPNRRRRPGKGADPPVPPPPRPGAPPGGPPPPPPPPHPPAGRGGRAGGVAAAGLKLRVGRRIIVEDASFTAAAGQVTALVGRAGGGKTAIMLALATLLRPTAGELRLCGVDLVRSPADARGMFGWAPQRPPAWKGYTVRRSLTATARLWGYSKADSVDRADVLIELLGLTDLAKTRVAVLSPAHQQLVSLAASLLNDPQVVLVDEPTSSLDHPITEHIISVLRALAAEGKAVLVTSQTDDAITDWTDRQHYLVAGHTADADAIARSMRSPQSWSIHTTEIVSLIEALRTMRLPYTADETRSEVHIVLENAQAASLLLSKLADVPITQYAPALSPAEHIISTLEEANRA
ncbi:MAG: ABC transporter ATP-binding protein [Pseudoclavibacter sp.]